MKTHAHRSWPLRRPGQLTPYWLTSLCVALLLALPARGQNPPVNVEEPEDTVISLGGDASFKARATATAPAWVEWYHTDGVSDTLLWGTNNNARLGVALTLTRVQAADARWYYAVITNDWGTATSRIAQVIIEPTFIKITTGSVVTDRATGAWESTTMAGRTCGLAPPTPRTPRAVGSTSGATTETVPSPVFQRAAWTRTLQWEQAFGATTTMTGTSTCS